MHRPRSRFLVGAATVGVCALLLSVGCSKDEPVSAPPPATAARTTVASGTPGGSAAADAAPTDFCRKFQEFSSRVDSLSDDNGDDFATAKSYFQQLADSAPPEIKDDMVTFNNWVQQLSTIQQNPPTNLMVTGQRIGSWAQQHCGLSG